MSVQCIIILYTQMHVYCIFIHNLHYITHFLKYMHVCVFIFTAHTHTHTHTALCKQNFLFWMRLNMNNRCSALKKMLKTDHIFFFQCR